MTKQAETHSCSAIATLCLVPLLIAGCAASQAPQAEPAATAAVVPPSPDPREEPLPRHWLGAFTMVQAGSATAGPRQYRLVFGAAGPNHFVATRGCYRREGRLLRLGDSWLVEAPEGVRADWQCLRASLSHSGFPEGLFEHRTVRLSPPGSERWIEEGGFRWLYLQNPAAPPTPPREPAESM